MDVARTMAQQQTTDENEEHKARGDIVVYVGDASTGAVHAVVLASAKYVLRRFGTKMGQIRFAVVISSRYSLSLCVCDCIWTQCRGRRGTRGARTTQWRSNG